MLPKSQYMRLSPAQKAKVKRKLAKRISGSGAYIFDKSKPFGHYGEKIGKALSGYIPFGRQIGAYGGHMIGKMFGSGAYVNARGKYIPSYRGAHKVIRGSGAYYDAPKGVATNATSPPSFGSNRTIIRHREFIGNIIGSTAFTINTWNVNPGDDATFPWLSNIAANYEKYRPIGMVFEFKSTSASALNSTNTALGTVMLAPRYNAVSQSVPASKMEMLQIENCVSICPAESGMVGIECAKNYNPLGVLYNRVGGAVPSGSEQLYDFCDFYLATEGMQASATIGELWVTYEIELLTPILGGGQIGDDIGYGHYYASAGITTSAFFGNNVTPTAATNFFVALTGTTITFPANITTGDYMIIIRYVHAAAGNTPPTITCTTNCSNLSLFNGGASNFTAVQGGATATSTVSYGAFAISAGSAVLTLSGGSFAGATPSYVDMIITQLPSYAS